MLSGKCVRICLSQLITINISTNKNSQKLSQSLPSIHIKIFSFIGRSQTTAKVYLIDVGTTMSTAATSRLFDLPKHFKTFDPLVCKLQLVSLVPFNSEDNYWTNEHKEKVIKMLEKFATEGYTFMCKVPLGIQDILFTESFDVKDEKDGMIKLRFKGKAMKENICMVDLSVEVKLRKLVLAFK